MNNRSKNTFMPDYVISPGEVLKDYMDALGVSQVNLSKRTGLAKKTINQVIKGHAPITPETALKLERVLGRPAHFWSNLERKYQDDRVRLAEQERLKEHLHWLEKFPINAMIKFGWLPKDTCKVTTLESVLRFFGIAAPELWDGIWAKQQADYRETKRFEKNFLSLAAWLRQGEIQAQAIDLAGYNHRAFRSALNFLRTRTKEPPEAFVPEMVEQCATAGVAVVFVPELPKLGVWGAAHWMENKPIIQLSLRYRSDDHLWFTFFHEAAHILLHKRKVDFIEDDFSQCAMEDEANAFARDILISPDNWLQLQTRGKPTIAEIEQFAETIGIAPGIVVGRLQHEGIIARRVGNNLKVTYSWEMFL